MLGMARTRTVDAPRRRAAGPILCVLALGTGSYACGSNAGPQIHDIEAQTAYVGSRLEFRVLASDPDGDPPTFTFTSPTVSRARLLNLDRNEAIFS